MGKCPKCDKLLSSVTGQPIDIKLGANGLKGLAYLCSFCQTILGVETDPLAIRTEIVAQVVDALRK